MSYEFVWALSLLVFGLLIYFDGVQLMHNVEAAERAELPEQAGKDATLMWDLLQWRWGILIQSPVWARQRHWALRALCWLMWLLPRVLFLYCISHRPPHMVLWGYDDETGEPFHYNPYVLCPYLSLAWIVIQQRMQAFTIGYKAGLQSALKRQGLGQTLCAEHSDEGAI